MSSTCAKLNRGDYYHTAIDAPNSCAWLANGNFVCKDNQVGENFEKKKVHKSWNGPHEYILRPISRFDYGAYREKKNDGEQEMSLPEFVHRRYAQGYPLKSETTGSLIVDATPFDIKMMKKASAKCGSCKKNRCNHCGSSYGGCKYCGVEGDDQ
jgi:hypothetical protein